MSTSILSFETPHLKVFFSPLGASVAGVQYRFEDGTTRYISLAPDSFESKTFDPSLTGRTIGPCCGRIKNGEVLLRDFCFSAEPNEGHHHIHGGSHGLAHIIWNLEKKTDNEITFVTTLKDGTDGYPGNRTFRAEYHLSDRTIAVRYTASTDRPTFIDMTNHIYWDLSGRFDGSAMKQKLKATASSYVINGPDHVPAHIVPAKDSVCDFSKGSSFDKIQKANPADSQLVLGRGWNNAILFSPEDPHVLVLNSPNNDLSMTMTTDAPSVVIYTGGFLDDQTVHLGSPAVPGSAIALEAQEIPDAFHLLKDPPSPLLPGEIFTRQIEWRFT